MESRGQKSHHLIVSSGTTQVGQRAKCGQDCLEIDYSYEESLIGAEMTQNELFSSWVLEPTTSVCPLNLKPLSLA